MKRSHRPFNIDGLMWVVFLGLFSIAIWMQLWTLAESSLRSEEAWVLLTVTRNGLHEMIFGTNYHPRTTPVGFLLIIRGITQFIGDSLFVVRFPAALTSLLTGALGYFICKKHFKSTAMAMLFVCAWNYNYIVLEVTKDLKQYGLDAFCSLFLIFAFLTALHSKKIYQSTYVAWYTLLVGIAVICSHPAVFTALVLALFWLHAGARSSKVFLRMWLLHTSVITIGFCTLYLLAVQPGAASVPAREVAFSRFMLGELDVSILQQGGQMIYSFFPYYIQNIFALRHVPPLLFVVLLGIGTFVFCHNNKEYFCISFGVFGVALLASFLGLYPLGGTATNLYLYPILILVLIQPITLIRSDVCRAVVVCIIIVLSVLSALNAKQGELKDGYNRMDSYLTYINSNLENGDALAICPAVEYFMMVHSISRDNYTIVGDWMDETAFIRDVNEIASSLNPKRIWLLCFSYEKKKVSLNSYKEKIDCKPVYSMQHESDQHAFLQLYRCI